VSPTLPVLHRAVPATHGNTRRLATLGPVLPGLEVRIVDEDANVVPTRGVGVIEVRGEPLTPGYTTTAGFVSAQDERGWYDTGDLGYLMENGHIVVCGRVKDVIIMAGRNIYPTDIERAAGRVEGVRRGCAVAVRLNAGRQREAFAVAVESNTFEDRTDVRRIQHQVAHEVSRRSTPVRATFPCWDRAPSRRRRRASCAARTRCLLSAASLRSTL
jgi:fatty-acyl-CoA synthase